MRVWLRRLWLIRLRPWLHQVACCLFHPWDVHWLGGNIGFISVAHFYCRVCKVEWTTFVP